MLFGLFLVMGVGLIFIWGSDILFIYFNIFFIGFNLDLVVLLG